MFFAFFFAILQKITSKFDFYNVLGGVIPPHQKACLLLPGQKKFKSLFRGGVTADPPRTPSQHPS